MTKNARKLLKDTLHKVFYANKRNLKELVIDALIGMEKLGYGDKKANDIISVELEKIFQRMKRAI